MQTSTRVNLEENYRYHAALADFHRQRMEEAGNGGEGGEGGEGETEPTAPPTNVDIPLIMGDAFPGGTLTCTMGNWDGEPDSYQYNWKSDGQPVKATTGGDTYQVLPEDVGHGITCVVVATNALGSTEAPPSSEVMIVAEGESQSQSGQQQSGQPHQAQSAQPRPPRTTLAQTSQQARSQQPAPHVVAIPSTTTDTKASRDETLFAMHDETAKQLRAVLDNWQDAPSQQQMREERPVVRRQSRATARTSARETARRITRH